MNFRSVSGSIIAWHDARIEVGFSNFAFIDQHYRSHPVLRRVLSLARMHGFKSLLVEKISATDCSLLANEDEALAWRLPSFQGSEVHRLSFWRCPPNQPAQPDDFIGYSIFKMDRFNRVLPLEGHIYEAVLPPFRSRSQNNYLHSLQTYQIATGAGIQSVEGVLYAQQNDRTFVCAHVSLRTALACILPDADFTYEQMNQIAGIDHVSRKVGENHGGLTPDDMGAILKNIGLHCDKIIHEPQLALTLPTEYQHDLYGFIESGDPALLGFELHDINPGPQGPSRHIVPVIGHTFNDDAWVPEAQRAYFGNALSYYSSEAWLSSYVLHDDNFGPYFCLPRHFLQKDNFRLLLGIRRHSITVGSVEAEAVALAFFNAVAQNTPHPNAVWYDRFVVYTKNGLLILRPILLEKNAYLEYLRTSGDTAPESEWIDLLAHTLPIRFWMIEASAQELFTASRRKFGEMLIACERPLPQPLNAEPLLAFRLPGILCHRESSALQIRTSVRTGHSPIFANPV